MSNKDVATKLIEALKGYIKEHDEDAQWLGKELGKEGWQEQECDCSLCEQARSAIKAADTTTPKADFLAQIPKPDRERIRDILVDILADGQVPESDFLLRPFEDGVDALVLEFRKIEGKSRLDADLTSKIIAAVRTAYQDKGSSFPFKDATSPTRPIIASIVAQGRKDKNSAATHAVWSEHAKRSQAALAERQAEEERDPWWEGVLDELKLQMTGATFDTLLKGTVIMDREPGMITVGVKSEKAKEWLDSRLRQKIARVVEQWGFEGKVEFEVMT